MSCYLLYVADEVDSVLTADGKLLLFLRLTTLTSYAARLGLTISRVDEQVIDFDKLISWCQQTETPCDRVLTAWNLFTDISHSIGQPIPSDQRNRLTDRIYDKLFYGSNLPAVTPEGHCYIPIWLARERTQLVTIMRAGLAMLKANAVLYEAELAHQAGAGGSS